MQSMEMQTAVDMRMASRRRRKEARPDELLLAAEELFARCGYAATRMEDIAARAGVTKGTLYLYFPNKYGLFDAVINRRTLPFLSGAEEKVNAYPGSMNELLREILGRYWEELTNSQLGSIARIVVCESGNFPEMVDLFDRVVIGRVKALTEKIVQQGIKTGEFRNVDVEALVHLILSCFLIRGAWNGGKGLNTADSIEPRERLSSYLDLVFYGLMARGSH